jgi:beta-galactosidase/beta-glucuronidase
LGPGSDYPRPHLRRERWSSLDGEWEFGAGARPVFNRHIHVPFCPESELSGIGERVGDVVWYRRRFDRPAGDRLLLHFGAVDYRATVWINGVEVVRHEGGHSPFTADITAALRSRDNVIVVRAEDSLTDKTIPRGKQYWKEEPEGIFYTATTGIWQPVWLEPLPERRISSLRLTARREPGEVDFEVEGEAEVVVRLEGALTGRGRGGSSSSTPSPGRPTRRAFTTSR